MSIKKATFGATLLLLLGCTHNVNLNHHFDDTALILEHKKESVLAGNQYSHLFLSAPNTELADIHFIFDGEAVSLNNLIGQEPITLRLDPINGGGLSQHSCDKPLIFEFRKEELSELRSINLGCFSTFEAIRVSFD